MMDIFLAIIFTIGALFFIIYRPYTRVENIIIQQNMQKIPEPKFIHYYKERLFDKNTQLPSLPDDHSQDDIRDAIHDPELGKMLEDEHKINEERQ